MVGMLPTRMRRHRSEVPGRIVRHEMPAMPSRGDFDRPWWSEAVREALQPDHGGRSRHGRHRHNCRRLRRHDRGRRGCLQRARRPPACTAAPAAVAADAATLPVIAHSAGLIAIDHHAMRAPTTVQARLVRLVPVVVVQPVLADPQLGEAVPGGAARPGDCESLELSRLPCGPPRSRPCAP
jgi:hypothetical protein